MNSVDVPANHSGGFGACDIAGDTGGDIVALAIPLEASEVEPDLPGVGPQILVFERLLVMEEEQSGTVEVAPGFRRCAGSTSAAPLTSIESAA
jgi:hypothetical protein